MRHRDSQFISSDIINIEGIQRLIKAPRYDNPKTNTLKSTETNKRKM